MTKNKKTVYMGMSGGVDSSVSATLLKEQGFDVVGVFIKVWQPDFVECTWREDRLDAMRVCAKLEIPFITLNLEREYKEDVADYMINEYKLGRTPNPDVMCNKYVKFGAFFDWAIEQGADFVATGHYARCTRIADQRGLDADRRRKNSQYQLLAGKDKNKDQSYFLWTLTQKQLSKTLFPVGDIEKPEVRRLAKKFGLSTSVKKDSQGVCFLGKFDMKDFLAHYIKENPGDVLNENGEIIGRHDGVLYLTVGQRHGFEITEKTPSDSPYYIVKKDIEKNTITVSKEKISPNEVDSKIVKIKDVNWTLGEEPDLSRKHSSRIRYRQPLEECEIKIKNHPTRGLSISTLTSFVRNSVIKSNIKNQDKEYEIHFINPQKAITPGQSVVIYDGEICLGGGIIS
jgi:tRNA-specific 2-thiouridylase